ncbi:hypothetical protein EST38_g14207 [Candolleomyces aberdarensis]|uniref:MULE transposase domain-containing protein n=1 Tax=Candolleomyces aberdarensis TaxID=2316362 RepID=A0A4V1Q1H9_9AGAR|nr:hypothetical protein EST38_g14207 [Candolleomyces aberdarensis]
MWVVLQKVYHFRKVQLLRSLSAYEERCKWAAQLTRELSWPGYRTVHKEFQPAVQFLLSSRIVEPLAGFLSTNTQLPFLRTLLDKDWVDEEVFNALAELAYFRQYREDVAAALNRHLLFLPTYFLAHVKQALLTPESSSSTTSNILNLRKRLSDAHTNKPIDAIAAFRLDGIHYTTYIYPIGSAALVHADSLHQPPKPEVTNILNAFLEPLGWAEIRSSGSYGIAALNFAQVWGDKRCKPWTAAQAREFREAALADLVIYHYFSSRTPGTVIDWVTPCIPALEMEGDGFAFGFGDFNMFEPQLIASLENRPGPNQPASINYPPQPSAVTNTASHRSKISFLLNPENQGASADSENALQSNQMGKSMPAGRQVHLVPPSTPQPLKRKSHEVFTPSPLRRTTSGHQKRHNTQFSPIEAVSFISPRRAPEVITIESDSDSEDQENLGDLFIGDSADSPEVKSISLLPPKSQPSPDVIDLTFSPSPIKVKEECSTKKNPTLTLPQRPTFNPVPSFKLKTDLGQNMIDLTLSPVKKVDSKARMGNPSNISANETSTIAIDQVFDSYEQAWDAIYNEEMRRGHQWKITFSYASRPNDPDSNKHKYTLACKRFRQHTPSHSRHVDPREWREGKTIKMDCKAQANIICIKETGQWYISTLNLEHNHGPLIEPGGSFRQPATQSQKDVIKRLATSKVQTFRRGQILDVLDGGDSGDHKLEPQQTVKQGGGDFAAILEDLMLKNRDDPGWMSFVRMDANSTVTGIWWQSPRQGALLRQYGDIILNDNTYNRNQYGYALNIGIIVDGQGSSRNVWYCLMLLENTDYHSWVLRCLLNASNDQHPQIFVSDRDTALIAAVRDILPMSFHIYCLHHLSGNFDTNLPKLAIPFNKFLVDFWNAFRAVSPEEFDHLWAILCGKYPRAANYLNKNLYETREHWAWAWTSHRFTAGIRTNGRVESENRITTNFGGPKKSAKQLYDGLNERTEQQSEKEKRNARDVWFDLLCIF